MITVVHQSKAYTCQTAIRGADYIHLLDADGNMCTAFDGVTDFSSFLISGGTWTSPTEDHDCYVGVVRDDGSVGKGGHRCSELLSAGEWSGWHDNGDEVLSAGDKTYQVRIETEDGHVLHLPPFELIDDAYNSQVLGAFMFELANGYLLQGYVYAKSSGYDYALYAKTVGSNNTLSSFSFQFQYRVLSGAVPTEYVSGDGVKY